MRTKEPRHENIRVVIMVPDNHSWLTGTTPAKISDAEELLKTIRRHCDGVEDSYVLCDTNYYCEHCGYIWTESSTEYNGGCCAKDEENNPELKEDKEQNNG